MAPVCSTMNRRLLPSPASVTNTGLDNPETMGTKLIAASNGIESKRSATPISVRRVRERFIADGPGGWLFPLRHDVRSNVQRALDDQGKICGITVEHASRWAGMPQFSYEQIAA